jgi:hypothetical protein
MHEPRSEEPPGKGACVRTTYRQTRRANAAVAGQLAVDGPRVAHGGLRGKAGISHISTGERSPLAAADVIDLVGRDNHCNNMTQLAARTAEPGSRQ